MYSQRACCCKADDTGCCPVYPVWCYAGEGCAGCWYPLYRTGVYRDAEITISYFGPDLTLSYVGVTRAIDPTTGDQFCGFPDPQNYPYFAPQPGVPPVDVFPYNYGVPIFGGTTSEGAPVEVVYPIINAEYQACRLVIGFEVRGGDFIQKLLQTWGASPNNLTGCADGTGEHWYLTSAGTLRYFADPGRLKSRNTGYGPGFQHPFHIQDIVHNLDPDKFTISTHNWCKENGECSRNCRCNHSWPEHKHCCRDLEVEFSLNYKTTCGTVTIDCAATFRTDWYPTNCQSVPGVPYLNGGQHYPLSNPNLPGGSWSLDATSDGINGCCTVNPAASTFYAPDVVAVRVGCNLTMAEIADPCDPVTTETWDMIALIEAGAQVTWTDCDGTGLVSSQSYIGVRFRNCGDGCCLHQMEPEEIWVLDFLTVPGTCVWKQAAGSINFKKRAGLC
jgi:hypothetical protein